MGALVSIASLFYVVLTHDSGAEVSGHRHST